MKSADGKGAGRMSDRVFAVLWLSVCAVIAFQMFKLKVPFAYEPVGPKAFPLLMAILMALCCLMLLIRPDHQVHWPERPMLMKGAWLVASLLAYAALFSLLGFPVATAAMSLVVARLFGGSWMSSSITAVLIGVLGYLVFDRLLEVSLPLGLLSLDA
ncbi:MAG: tripartite tricarboxylate transporter TctB family protein [Xanthomonadales bacterium]|nr:tripartite tricarboxylate transporter TctB family protein [Xanthomonadales bacterium]